METADIIKVLIFFGTTFAVGMFSYFFGAAKTFREQKQKVYIQAIETITKFIYEAEKLDEDALNKMLIAMALYSGKNIYERFEKIISMRVNGEIIKITALTQELISMMRQDIQLNPFQKLSPETINHLFIKFKNEPPSD